MSLLPTRTDLVYDIVELTLTGTIDGVSISANAGSGGRAGSKTRETAGKAPPTLEVISVGDFGLFDRLNATA